MSLVSLGCSTVQSGPQNDGALDAAHDSAVSDTRSETSVGDSGSGDSAMDVSQDAPASVPQVCLGTADYLSVRAAGASRNLSGAIDRTQISDGSNGHNLAASLTSGTSIELRFQPRNFVSGRTSTFSGLSAFVRYNTGGSNWYYTWRNGGTGSYTVEYHDPVTRRVCIAFEGQLVVDPSGTATSGSTVELTDGVIAYTY